MRAITFDHGLRYDTDRPEPRVGSGECLLRVRMAGICATDHEIVRGYLGFAGVLGHEMVATVDAGSERWAGRRVACEINCVCGACGLCQSGLANHCPHRTVVGIVGRDGCFADYVAVPERNLHALPDSISDEQAVFVEPLAAAFQVLKQVPVDRHTKVAVVGSGRLGLLVAQVLRGTGCGLLVVGRNPMTLAFCDKLGIQSVAVDDLAARRDRDVVVECTGSDGGLAVAMSMVRPRGTVVIKSTYAGLARVDLSAAVVNELNLVGSRCGPFSEAIEALAGGTIDVAGMISRVYRLEKGLAAFEASAGRDRIKVLLRVGAE